MRRAITLLFLVAACGGDAAPATQSTTSNAPATTATTQASSPTTTVPLTTSTDSSVGVEPTTTTAVREKPEGEDAPNFVLTLGEGGTFSLSDEQKPVYMVFWAEW